jgi:hypothetical protein
MRKMCRWGMCRPKALARLATDGPQADQPSKREGRTLSRRTQTTMSPWQCGHFSPVLVEDVDGGKKIARCLQCGERGKISEGSEEALRGLRDRARQRDEAQSA